MKGILESVNRPGPSDAALKAVGVPAMDNPTDDGNDLQSFMTLLRVAAGLNHIIQINDCETAADFTESDNGVFDVAASAATGKRVGTNCMKLSSTGACDGTQYVQSLLIDESSKIARSDGKRQADWRDSNYIGFWIHNETSGDYSTAGEMKFAIVNNGTESTQSSIPALTDSVHAWYQVDISGYRRDQVESIRFYADVGAGEDLYVDDIIRYQVQFNGGPLYGKSFPITSGTTLSENHWAQWTADGLIASVTAANVADLGPSYLGASSKVGVAGRSVHALVPLAYIFLIKVGGAVVAGEGLEWKANGSADGGATGVDENCFAKALEAGGADGDWIFATLDGGGNFVS